MPDGYGIRQAEAMDRLGPLCVGIDPHAGLLKQWELSDDAEGLREFSLRLVEALGGRVAAFKPQSAFYARHGSRGVAVLEETLDAIRSFGSISILDVKRGDIGSTMDGYAEAYLGENSSLRADAMTVSIAQFGSTRSINAGVAAGIAMHAWVRTHADLEKAWK